MVKKSDQKKDGAGIDQRELVAKMTGASPVEGEQVDPVKATETDPVAETLITEMSPPNPDAIAAMKAQQENKEVPVDETPEPGKRKRGRPKGSTTSRVSSMTPGGNKANVAKAQQQADDREKSEAVLKMSAATAANMTIMSGYMIGGEDFKPGPNILAGGMDDQKILADAYEGYFRSKGIADLPPGIALTMALGIYVAPRLRQPTTQSRLKIFVLKAGEFIKKFRKGKNATQSDSRDDGKRKDNVGETTRA